MADDALLAIGAYTGDAAFLQKIVEDYPRGDMVEKAKNLLEEMKSSFINISDDGRGRLKVAYRVAAPQPGLAVAQALTYPYAMATKSTLLSARDAAARYFRVPGISIQP